MKHQLHLLLTAFGFFTRIPIPKNIAFSQANLNKCNRYFPIVGLAVGGITALVYYLVAFVWPQPVAVILSMISSILLTGAFHEDGFADICDGFGGGWTKDKILTIMKDSRVGAYGAIGILLLLMAKYSALSSLPPSIIVLSIITSHILSRLMAVWTMHSLFYVREDESSKSKPITKALKTKDLSIAIFLSLTSMSIWLNPFFLLIIIPMYIAKRWMEVYFKKWIGGYTGDCLGAIQQVTEVVCYLAIFAVNKHLPVLESFIQN